MGGGPVPSLEGIGGVFVLAIIGLVALIGGGLWLLWWLVSHLQWVSG